MKSSKIRIRIITFCVVLFALLLIGRLYLTQIVMGNVYTERGNEQYVSSGGQIFDRGSIYFQDKDGSLMAAASLKTGYTIAVNPKLVTDPDTYYAKLSAIIPLDHDTFIAEATKKNDTYEQIATQVDPDKATAITALNLSGVNTYMERWRYYPGQTLAADILGFVGYNSDNTYTGRYGLEEYYNNVLERDDADAYVNFFAEIFSDIHKTFTDNGTVEGDIVSTIDPNVQAALEAQLQDIQDQYHSQISGGIVIDPNNGEIYAMAANPTFNPNTYSSVSDISVYKNPLVQNVYELGSIMKSVTMAIGLDTGAVTPNTTYDDTASITLDGQTIHNWDLVGHGVINMQKVLSDSLNVGAAYVESKIGNQRFADYMYKFGFGEKTGIDLPDEATNLVSNLQSNRDIEYATASFGQGVAVSPISMVRALCALANGGNLVTPHVISKIQYNVGFTKTIDPPVGPRVISASTSQAITGMLVNVVDQAMDADVGGDFSQPHYSIAAKTGTAQLVNTSTGGYYSNRYLHSFFGYFPASNPRFLVFLYTDDPQGQELAVHTLALPFLSVAKFLINYYDLPPDR